MTPIKQFINKIKFSGKFNPKDITLYYYDRILKKLTPLKYENVKLEEDYLIHNNSQIPLHRVYEVRKNNIIIWKRELKKEL